MARLTQILVTSLLAGLCTAACTSPGARKAWHTLTDDEKQAYIDAELCLMEMPASLGIPGARTRFDEFQAIHQLQAFSTHYVGAFLPFHRAMLFAHETALREECGYEGYQPYWQEQLDAGNFKESILFDDVLGFGGDGDENGCITTGPFAHYTNALGPGYEINDHCIDRRINETMSMMSSQAEVDICMAKEDWLSAWECIEGPVHIGGHAGTGGQMSNGVSSPGDPLFYLHHTWLDKIWWDWQKQDKCARTGKRGMGGTNIGPDSAPNFPPRPSHIPKPTGADGDPGTETTLGHILNMYGNSRNYTIGEVMNIQGEVLCYEYIEP